jgi:putative ABC transport system permease protein
MFRNYLVTAWRNILKHKVITLINILGLSIAVCSCLAIYQIARFELSYDRFHPGGDRIYRLVSNFQQPSGEIFSWGSVPDPVANQARLELSGMASITNFHTFSADARISGDSEVFKEFAAPTGIEKVSNIIFVDSSYFRIFEYIWLAGSPLSAVNEPFKVVLSEKQAHRYFGSLELSRIIGKEVIYNDSVRVVVSGIVKDWDRNSDLTFRDFISYSTLRTKYFKNEIHPDDWRNINTSSQTFIKLMPGVSPGRFGNELKIFSKEHVLYSADEKYNMLMQPLSDLHFNRRYKSDYGRFADRSTILGLIGIAVFMLIIASINFINLSIAKSLQRAKEIGVRKVLGSRRIDLIVQILTESFILSIVALVISLLFLRPALNIFPSIVPDELHVQILDRVSILFILLLPFVTAILSGFYPAWILSSFSPANTLKNKKPIRTSKQNNFRKALIVFQFTTSIIFIIASILIRNQIKFVLNKDLGFNKEVIININTNDKEPAEKRHLLAEKLRNLSGIDLVSLEWFAPIMAGPASTTIDFLGPSNIKASVDFRFGDEYYIPLYKFRLLAGRNFRHSDTLNELVINENCAKVFGFSQPREAIDKVIDMWGKKCPIVGVVKDFNVKPLEDSIVPVVIGSMDQFAYNLSVRLQSGHNNVGFFNKTIVETENIWRTIYPNAPFVYTFFDENIAKLYSGVNNTNKIINAAMITAIFISCIGLFSLAALTAEQRTKEIGIRKVLGAGVIDVVTLLSKEFVLLVIIAFAISSPIAYFLMTRWLHNFAYRINIGWWPFAFAGISASVVAMVTISFQTVKAALRNPILSLRTD